MSKGSQDRSGPSLVTLPYETPARDDEVPTLVPQVDALIDAGRSIRGVGALFPSYLSAATYVHGVFAHRLARVGRICIGCGQQTDGRIGVVWRVPVPWPRQRDTASLVVVHNYLTASHACCTSCTRALRARIAAARRRNWAALSIGTVAFFAWYVFAVHQGVRGQASILQALFPFVIVVLLAVILAASKTWARHQLPERLTKSVPGGLRFVRWTDPSTVHFDLEKALSAARAIHDVIEIRGDALDVTAAIAAICDPRAGGVDVFLGTTRGEVRESDRVDLVALDYEAYEAMAVSQLRRLVAAARERWPIVRCAILHRTGRVGLGEASVLIAVSCPHRVAAFESCRFLIDELKRDVAIWKKECWADGSVSWVHPETGVVTIGARAV